MIRIRLLSVCFLVFAFLTLACKQKEQLPNILFILVDDLGIKDLGCYGQEIIQTPNIDRLSSEGMHWKNAYSSCPVCSPTRVALLTGKSPARVHFTGHITAIEKHRRPENSAIIPPDDLMYIPLEEKSLAEALKPAGYVSGSFGKWHVGTKGYWPEDQGFDLNIGGWTHGSPPAYFYPYSNPESDWNAAIPTLSGGTPGEYLPDRLTNEAISFMTSNRDRSFLVYLAYYAVHTPLQAPDSLIAKYTDLVKGSRIDPIYAAMVDRVDYNVGRIMETLHKLDLYDNTFVILTSDNGGLEEVTDNRPFRRGKGHLYEGGIRVPLIIRWPGKIKAGSSSSRRIISEDIFATIVDIAACNAIPGNNIDGRSLLPDFYDKGDVEQRDLHWYYPHYGIGMDPGAIIISGSYKLIEHYDPYRVELFNLAEDVSETNDLAIKNSDKRDELLTKLHVWIESVNPIMHTANPEYKIQDESFGNE